jgi:hypothetical protein
VDYKVEARREYKSAMAALTDTTWNAKTRENLEDLVVSPPTPNSLATHLTVR